MAGREAPALAGIWIEASGRVIHGAADCPSMAEAAARWITRWSWHGLQRAD